VFTRSHGHAPEAAAESLSVRNAPTGDFGEMLASHAHRVKQLKLSGLRPTVGPERNYDRRHAPALLRNGIRTSKSAAPRRLAAQGRLPTVALAIWWVYF
jgi:hypothetical protein